MQTAWISTFHQLTKLKLFHSWLPDDTINTIDLLIGRNMWSLLWIIIKCVAWFSCAITSQCLKKTGSSVPLPWNRGNLWRFLSRASKHYPHTHKYIYIYTQINIYWNPYNDTRTYGLWQHSSHYKVILRFNLNLYILMQGKKKGKVCLKKAKSLHTTLNIHSKKPSKHKEKSI